MKRDWFADSDCSHFGTKSEIICRLSCDKFYVLVLMNYSIIVKYPTWREECGSFEFQITTCLYIVCRIQSNSFFYLTSQCSAKKKKINISPHKMLAHKLESNCICQSIPYLIEKKHKFIYVSIISFCDIRTWYA